MIGTTATGRSRTPAVAAELTRTNAAMDRYFAVFENGAMDESTAGPRLEKLGTKAKQLRQRHAELSGHVADEPAMPTPAELDEIITHSDLARPGWWAATSTSSLPMLSPTRCLG
jgi:hypothetical protein